MVDGGTLSLPCHGMRTKDENAQTPLRIWLPADSADSGRLITFASSKNAHIPITMYMGSLSSQQVLLRPHAPIVPRPIRGAGQQNVIRHSLSGKPARQVAGRCVVVPRATASAQASSTIKMSVQGRHLEVTPALGCAAAAHSTCFLLQLGNISMHLQVPYFQ